MNKILDAIELIKRISPNTPMREAEALAPILINQNNQEAWYKSRVTLGAIASILTGVGSLATSFATRDFNPETLYIAAGAIGGGFVTLYGRWSAKAPIGE